MRPNSKVFSMSESPVPSKEWSNPLWLHKELIHCIVDALETNMSVERALALEEKRKIDGDFITALHVMRRFENDMNGVDSDYAKISFRL